MPYREACTISNVALNWRRKKKKDLSQPVLKGIEAEQLDHQNTDVVCT